VSIHQLKKDSNISLRDYFIKLAGGLETDQQKEQFNICRCNFIDSLAAYSIVTYILAVKDRHNGNILIHKDGHIIHIDFGFFLSNSPGSMNFETSPFKMTQEYLDFIGGTEGPMWQYFKVSLNRGFFEVRKYYDHILGMIEFLLHTKIDIPCLKRGAHILEEVKERFYLGKTEKECEIFVENLLEQSINNPRTKQYDHFQYLSNGILY